MYQHGRVARSRRNLGFAHWLATAGVFAACAPLGCAVYESSLQPSDDVAGLQADAGAASDLLEGGSGGVSNGGRAGSEPGSAGAPVMAAGGAGAGSAAGGAAGASTGHAGGAASAGAPNAGAGGGLGGASNLAGSGNAGSPGSAGAGTGSVVELARGKAATASSEQAGNEAPQGNDASLSTRWCALHGTFPQWWRVDLGAKHALHDFSVKFEHGERKYSYKVETSNDDSVYTVQSTISGTGDVQSDTFASGVSGRYVRITVTSADPYVSGTTTYPTWASFWDFTVNGW
jgi:F5/8 type C domain